MLCCKWFRKLAFLGAMTLASSALAQEPVLQPAASPSAEALIKRLEEAEARIKSLEGDLKSIPVLVDQGQPGAGAAIKPAADGGIDSRLKTLEDSYKADKAAQKKKTDDDSRKPSIKIGGRMDLDAHFFPTADPLIDFLETGGTTPPQANYQVRRARIEASGEWLENMIYKIEMEFASPRDPQFRDLYVGFKNLPFNNTVFIGNHKKPLGLENMTSSRFLTFIERSLPDDTFNPDQRRPGIKLEGYADSEVVGWMFGVYSLNDWNDSTNNGTFTGNSPQATINARLFASPWYDCGSDGRGYLHVGISGQYADPYEDPRPVLAPPSTGTRPTVDTTVRYRNRPELRSFNRWVDTGALATAFASQIAAAELAVNVGSFNAAAEYFASSTDRLGTGNALNFSGGYVSAGYFLTGEHRPYNRQRGVFERITPHQNFFLVERCGGGTGSGWGAFEVAARASMVDLTDGVGAGEIFGGVEKNLTFGLNWYLNPYAKIQFNYVIGSIDERIPSGAPAGLPRDGDFTGIATRLHIDF